MEKTVNITSLIKKAYQKRQATLTKRLKHKGFSKGFSETDCFADCCGCCGCECLPPETLTVIYYPTTGSPQVWVEIVYDLYIDFFGAGNDFEGWAGGITYSGVYYTVIMACAGHTFSVRKGNSNSKFYPNSDNLGTAIVWDNETFVPLDSNVGIGGFCCDPFIFDNGSYDTVGINTMQIMADPDSKFLLLDECTVETPVQCNSYDNPPYCGAHDPGVLAPDSLTVTLIGTFLEAGGREVICNYGYWFIWGPTIRTVAGWLGIYYYVETGSIHVPDRNVQVVVYVPNGAQGMALDVKSNNVEATCDYKNDFGGMYFDQTSASCDPVYVEGHYSLNGTYTALLDVEITET